MTGDPIVRPDLAANRERSARLRRDRTFWHRRNQPCHDATCVACYEAGKAWLEAPAEPFGEAT